MKASFLQSSIPLIFLVVAGCNKERDHQAQSSPQAPPASRSPELPPVRQPATAPNNGGDHSPAEEVTKSASPDPYLAGFEKLKGALSLEKIRSTDVKTLAQERKDLIKSIAAEKGVSESDVLVDFFTQNRAADAYPSALGRAYLDNPEVIVDSYLRSFEGNARSSALISYASSLAKNSDVDGIQKMYDLIPPGKDRGSIGSKLVLTAARTQGVGNALDILGGMDLPEEKRTALLGLCANFDSAKSASEGDINRVYAVAKELGNEPAVKSAMAVALQQK